MLIIDELDNFMAGIFEVFNDHVIVADDVTAHADSVEDLRLAYSKILNHESQACIYFVVLFKTLVHLFSLASQVLDLKLLRSDVSS